MSLCPAWIKFVFQVQDREYTEGSLDECEPKNLTQSLNKVLD